MGWNNHAHRIAALVVGVATLVACGGNAPRLEPEERFIYEIKPSVVRVNAFATARFSYPASEIRSIEKTIAKSVSGVVVRRLSGTEREELESGTGSSGSGFVINPSGYIVTSSFVASAVDDLRAVKTAVRRQGAEAALVRHFSAEPLRQLAREKKLAPLVERLARAGSVSDLSVVEDVELANGERYGFERRSSIDEARALHVAIIRIRRRNLPTARLGDSAPVRVEDPVWVAGYSSVSAVRDEVVGGWLLRDTELEATFNPGLVTAIRALPAGGSELVTNAAIYEGNTGGPAISRGDGTVIGMAVLRGTTETAKKIVPIDAIKDVVAQSGVSYEEEGDFQANYKRALDRIEAGRIEQASSELAFASQLFPNYPDLIRFVAEAEQVERKPSFMGLPLVVIGALSLAVIVFASLAAYFAMRVRRASEFVPPPIPKITHESFVAPSSRDGSERVPETGQELLGQITILSGDRAGERIGLGGSGIRVGREHSMCEIVMENPKVSRLHAEFVDMDGRVLLIDRNSSNGTYVNDQRIDKRFLEDGDIIYFGGRNAIAVAFNA